MLLDELGIGHLADQRASLLSGGERRRLEISRALATDPSFILLDEPFAGIDPLAVIDIKKIIGHLKSRGIGILISDHNVRETLGVCDTALYRERRADLRIRYRRKKSPPAKSPADSILETNSGYNMAIELRQQLKLTQQLIMTPQLQMAIKLLQLSRLELLDTIRQEMEENPALEEVQERAGEESEADEGRTTTRLPAEDPPTSQGSHHRRKNPR